MASRPGATCSLRAPSIQACVEPAHTGLRSVFHSPTSRGSQTRSFLPLACSMKGDLMPSSHWTSARLHGYPQTPSLTGPTLSICPAYEDQLLLSFSHSRYTLRPSTGAQQSRGAACLPRVVCSAASNLPARGQLPAVLPPPPQEPSSLVPRRCTLKELRFSEDGRLITTSTNAFTVGSGTSELIGLFLATVEASAQVKDLETLTGRLSMVAFLVAIAVEYMTGSGLFSSVDHAVLQKFLGLGLLFAVGAGSFAVAMRGKQNVTDILSSGCQRFVDSTLDHLVDALFFEDRLVVHQEISDEKQLH